MAKRGLEDFRTYEEINKKIKLGDAIVLTADEFIEKVENIGIKKASKEVDVITTGTFGAMCSSGAFLNFGHSDPPIKMIKCWLNDVSAYGGLAAVDCYIGATELSETKGFEYGGGHLIEDLVNKKEVELRAESYGTDCYPRKFLETNISVDDLNQAVLLNPRNAYERYNAAINSTDRVLYTYMGTLLPNHRNITYCGSGQLSPLYKDKNFEVIGIGTRIFLGGSVGYVIGEGTQHNPQNQLGTISVRGDLKQMNSNYLKGATYSKYGTTLYVGLGIPIPILNEKVASSLALKDSEIFVDVIDYGVPSRKRPKLAKVSYSELKSGTVLIHNKEIKTSPLSSFKIAKEISITLKKWIENKKFSLNKPAELIADDMDFKPLEIRKKELLVKDIMKRKVITGRSKDKLKNIAKIITQKNFDHLPIIDKFGKLIGIITSWDLVKAIAQDKEQLKDVMTSKVITARENEVIDIVARRMAQNHISGVPVIDDFNRVVGILTSDDISKKIVGRLGVK
jgi:uncharacterized protein (DUF39 family)/CBS domain-containing protein